MISNFISNYFGFNRQQRNGLFVLVLISFLLLLVRLIYPYFITPDNIIIQNLPLIEHRLDSGYAASNSYKKHNYENSTANLFVFNPNTVSYEQLLALGFREKTAKTFLKFRSKGFVFKEKKDLQKIYGIHGNFYEKLEPYILIEPAGNTPGGQKTTLTTEVQPKPAAQKTLELNSCDSIALTGLNGIGPSYAKRILKYRTILGGYVSIDQLKEVYGFPEELFEKVKSFVTVNASLVKKINLNKDDFKTVNRHPYLSYELTKVIFDWRRKTTLTAVNLKDVLNDEVVYKKILPYVEF